jgi:diaminopimelate decarboxylase
MSWPYTFPPLDGVGVSASGELELAGHAASALLARFGSPLVVMLEDTIRRNCREYRSRLAVYPHSRTFYASKAFLTQGMCRLMRQEGFGLDVVSGGELYTALSAAFPAGEIVMHGNAKGRDELGLALEHNIGRVIVDNLDEIELLAELAARRSAPVAVQLRVTPGVKPSTHQYVQTGQLDSKFGFNLTGGAALAAAQRILELPQLSLVGLHCHIGSQIFDGEPFRLAAQIMLDFYAELKTQHGAPLGELNLGGGIGIRYQPADSAPSVTDHVAELSRFILERCQEHGVDPPVLCDEPGRSIVGEAGVTLYTVQSTKVIPEVRSYASVDGGMTDNPRFALYGARHAVACANRLHEPHDAVWSVAGKCCETGDMLIKDTPLPATVRRGDTLAFFSTGAYTYSMASNYNRVGRPAVALVKPGAAELLARRETPEDLVRLDLIPSWLEPESVQSDW